MTTEQPLTFLGRKEWTTAQALEWALQRIRISLDCGEYFAKAEAALRIAQPEALSAWQPIATAPKDGTLVFLLIAPDEERVHPLEDTAGLSRTIGQNNFDNDGEDKWEFAGWCWSHDHYTQGDGNPACWMPLPSIAPSPQLARSEEPK